ncbi:hypothetical protein [Acidovorax sp. NCPPB 3576]|uniref:hypothetical protein n=1 Tax=Acidovorax sp. NCPPB 3576 TaxID=2940488 RepID=UPI00234A56CE|nr:hypothetical protein [Acidovorax sp. NCPPB 3576]WCM87876.1 hypothetical protein M5C98_21440 [Acidovorax sp. NCPPB 3576]
MPSTSMSASAKQPPQAWGAGAHRIVPHEGVGVRLRLVSMVQPPIFLDDGFPRSSGLWVSSNLLLPGCESALTQRHMAVQGLLVRLEALAGQEGRTLNRTLRLFSDNRLSQVHASSADFERLSAPSGLSGPAGPAASGTETACIDEEREWLLVDAQKGFHPGGVAPSAALIAALVRLAEVPVHARRRLVDAGDPAGTIEAAKPLVLEAARALAQQGLGDTKVQLSAQAIALAEHLSPAHLIQWLLTDAALPFRDRTLPT